jgi:hypothetical protein
MKTEEWLAAFDKRNARNRLRRVELDELPEPIYMRKQTVGDIDAGIRYDKQHSADDDYEPTVYQFCRRLCEENGDLIFNPDDAEHRRRIREMIGDDVFVMKKALEDGEETTEGK